MPKKRMTAEHTRFLRFAEPAARQLEAAYHDRTLEAPEQLEQSCKALDQTIRRMQQARFVLQRAARRRSPAVFRAASNLTQYRRNIMSALGGFDVASSKIQQMRHTTCPTVHDIVQEIRQLEREFKRVSVDRNSIVVTTDAIELETVQLGRFQVTFTQAHLSGRNYSINVEALEPCYGDGDEGDHPHPHISGGSLCVGEGDGPLRKAAGEGRIADWFMLVDSLLKTYNPDSAYVKLGDWDPDYVEYRCEACQDRMSEDDRTYCEDCGSDVCESCSSSCHECEEYHCNGCLSRCDDCGERFCRSCLVSCDKCNVAVCGNCVVNDKHSGGTVCKSCAKACDACGEDFEQGTLVRCQGPDCWMELCPDCRNENPEHPGMCGDCAEELSNNESEDDAYEPEEEPTAATAAERNQHADDDSHERLRDAGDQAEPAEEGEETPDAAA